MITLKCSFPYKKIDCVTECPASATTGDTYVGSTGNFHYHVLAPSDNDALDTDTWAETLCGTQGLNWVDIDTVGSLARIKDIGEQGVGI